MRAASRTLFGAAYTLAMSGKGLLAAHLHGDDQVIRELAVTWARTLCSRSGVRLTATGVDRANWNEPLVVCANHQSLFDVPAIVAALGRAFGFLSKKELRNTPLFGRAMERAGCVFIDRGDPESAQQSIAAAATQVKAGSSIVVFPEGTRAPGRRVLPFKKGPFYLVQAAQVPLVPVGIIGTDAVLHRSGVLVRPADVEVRVGQPLYCGGESVEARETLRDEAEAAILTLTGFVRA